MLSLRSKERKIKEMVNESNAIAAAIEGLARSIRDHGSATRELASSIKELAKSNMVEDGEINGPTYLDEPDSGT